MSVWTIVVAAGTAARFGALKQIVPLGMERVVDRSVRVAMEVSDGVITVAPSGLLSSFPGSLVVAGGPSRTDSVRNGLMHLPSDVSYVLVHDAARPLATAELYLRVIQALRDGARAVIPVVGVRDTLKRIENDKVVATVSREGLAHVQTPQGFEVGLLLEAYALAMDASDDASLVEELGVEIRAVPGEEANFKITTKADLSLMAKIVGDDSDECCERGVFGS